MSAEPEVIEIPEDAYRRNDVVRPWPQPEEGKPEEGAPMKAPPMKAPPGPLVIRFAGRNEQRVRQALARREELLRQRTADMAKDWSDEFYRVETIISSAVAWAVKAGAK